MIDDVIYFDSNEIEDIRGSFLKIFSKNWIESTQLQFEECFVTKSIKGTTRGMHIQVGPTENWKIISVIEGHIFDVLVDVRKNSGSYLKIINRYIRGGTSIILPPGIGHGFQAIENSILIYLSSKSRVAEYDLGFNAQSLPIDWPLDFKIQSERDKNLPNIEYFIKTY
jgi:dTDP-4-dehydrorhamnose 3,5-epimerase